MHQRNCIAVPPNLLWGKEFEGTVKSLLLNSGDTCCFIYHNGILCPGNACSIVTRGGSKGNWVTGPNSKVWPSVKEEVKECASYLWKSISQLRSVTCRMGSQSSHSVTWHPTQANTPCLYQSTPARQAGTRFTDHLRMEG